MGWFFGFKVHLITNDKGELLSIRLTKGNVDDRQPIPKMIKNIFGNLFGDKGYLSGKLSEKLRSNRIKLITTVRKNMKNELMPLLDKIMLRKRFIIETINDKLKNECQIEHTRHRSPMNFLINLLAGLICYQINPKKPALKMPSKLNKIMVALSKAQVNKINRKMAKCWSNGVWARELPKYGYATRRSSFSSACQHIPVRSKSQNNIES